MNLYRFIDSEDIREYLRNSIYQFTATEAAFIVWQSKTATLAERHEAWRHIVATMPDCEIAKRPNTVYRESLHGYLKELMDFENSLLNRFQKTETDVVYMNSIFIPDDNRWIDFNGSVFAGYDICLKNAMAKCAEFVGASAAAKIRIEIRKLWLNETKKYIEARIDANGNVRYFTQYGNLNDSEYDLVLSGFDGMWFAFPTPFKMGDILQTEGGDVFVLTKISTEDRFRKRLEANGDTTDMTADGYFLDSDRKELFYDSAYNYMRFEKYTGELNGKLQILRMLSRFLKGELDPEEYTNHILSHMIQMKGDCYGNHNYEPGRY